MSKIKNFNIKLRKYEPYIVVEDDQQWRKLNGILILIFPKVIIPIVKLYLKSHLVYVATDENKFSIMSVDMKSNGRLNGFYRAYTRLDKGSLKNISGYIKQEVISHDNKNFKMAITSNKFYATKPVEYFEHDDATPIYRLTQKSFYKYNKLDTVPTRWDGKELATNQSSTETYNTGQINRAEWYFRGMLHRQKAPAVTMNLLTETAGGQLNYHASIKFEYYYYGKVHRAEKINGVYRMASSVSEPIVKFSWQLHGRYHNPTDVAVIYYINNFEEGSEKETKIHQLWYLYGRIHKYKSDSLRSRAEVIYNIGKSRSVGYRHIHSLIEASNRIITTKSGHIETVRSFIVTRQYFKPSFIEEQYNQKGEKTAEKERLLFPTEIAGMRRDIGRTEISIIGTRRR